MLRTFVAENDKYQQTVIEVWQSRAMKCQQFDSLDSRAMKFDSHIPPYAVGKCQKKYCTYNMKFLVKKNCILKNLKFSKHIICGKFRFLTVKERIDSDWYHSKEIREQYTSH